MAVCDTQISTISERCIRGSEYDGVTPGHVLSPWACIRFESIDETYKSGVITVGNRSSTATDTPNAACIKSLEFGQEDGFSVRVVIHDQQGGAFDKFVENCVNDWRLYSVHPTTVKMVFQFGWTKAGCNNPVPLRSTPKFYCFTNAIETSYMEGKFIAEVTGDSVGNVTRQGAIEKIFGEDGQLGSMCIRDAITLLATHPEIPPSVSQVDFVKLVTTKNGIVPKPCGFADFDPDCGKLGGPKRVWPCSSLDKLHVIHTWLKDCKTENNKAWSMAYDPTVKGERLVIFESNPICKPADTYCIARYIVNGGKYSPVLEFNPKINWDFASLASNGGGMTSETVTDNKSKGLVDCVELSRDQMPGAGQMIQRITPQGMKDRHGKWAARESYDAQMRHMKANFAHLYHNDIEADLVIVGDPSFINPWLLIDKTITIYFINPFFVTKSGNERCGEWLANPPINNYLSSDAWRIQGVTHKIELGSFTTTLRVRLSKGDLPIPPNAELP
jgi:hypothetical protein